MKLVATLLLAVAFACAPTARAADTRAPQIGATAPLALGKAGKEDVDLSAYRGKVVIVTFWASWCTYCLQELPALNTLQEQVGDQWLKVIAVNVQDDNNDYRAMTRQMRDYKIVLARDKSGDIAATYGVRAYPNLWMIDPQGKVAAHHLGYAPESLPTIIEDIKRLLTRELERQKQGATAAN